MFIKIGSIYVESRPKYDDEPILHISLNTFHQLKCFIFVIFVCVIIQESRVLQLPPVSDCEPTCFSKVIFLSSDCDDVVSYKAVTILNEIMS